MPSPQAPTTKLPSCRECRARKVRCDRVPDRCGPCTRFALSCSYATSDQRESRQEARPSGDASAGQVGSTSLTESGFARRRIRRACKSCRALKVKCSGDVPCTRCRSHHHSCTYTYQRQHQTLDQKDNPGCINADSATVPASRSSELAARQETEPTTVETPASRISATTATREETSAARGRLTEDRIRALKDIETYFEDASRGPACVQFLHRPSVLADLSQDRLDPTLAATLCALGRLSTSEEAGCRDGAAIRDDLGATDAREWMLEAQRLVFGWAGTTAITQLQTLILIVQYHTGRGAIMDAWNLISVGARLAFTLRLNYELPGRDHDPVVQETRRRMMWSIWLIDRLFAGGIEDLIVCPTERIHIRLPCDDYTFQRGVTSRAGFLMESTIQTETSGLDSLGYYLRLNECRHKILRYTKRVIREGSSPTVTCAELDALQYELTSLERNLPEDLRLSPERLRLKAHSHDAGGYVALHMLWNQCHCDLYRFMVPGMRETVSSNVYKFTPTDFALHCQTACLHAAVRAADLLADLYRLGFRKARNIPNLIVGVYQIAQIFYHLRHLLQPNADSCRSIEDLQTTLREAHCMIPILQPKCRLESKPAELLAETDLLIQGMSRGVEFPKDVDSTCVPIPRQHTGSTNKSTKMWSENAQHLSSRGSLLDDLAIQTSSANEGTGGRDMALSSDRDRDSAAQPACARENAERAEQDLPHLQPEAGNTSSELLGNGSAEAWQSTQRFPHNMEPVEMTIPWDPFDMQINDYNIAGLETMLLL